VKEKTQKMKKILIVDDSIVFRTFLNDIFDGSSHIEVVGEAANGIEALGQVFTLKPDVILLDLEMPLMDGMTTLHQLMIHKPTPVIMFSSLSRHGTARCFDTYKNGAIDFVGKDFIFHKNNQELQQRMIVDKILRASRMRLEAREPIGAHSFLSFESKDMEKRVIFCEECGSRQVLESKDKGTLYSIPCSNCGDLIELQYSAPDAQHRQNKFVTVMGGGVGGYYNLLQIVPKLKGSMNGSVIAVIHGDENHLNVFTEYLDAISSINVIRGREGISLEAGNCYIISEKDRMAVKPFSTQLGLEKVGNDQLDNGPLDLILSSVATHFKAKSEAIILAGHITDGEKGGALFQSQGGEILILSPRECYSTVLGTHIARQFGIKKALAARGVVQKINKRG
jgi:two-component system chemotaxis response regulator CheB